MDKLTKYKTRHLNVEFSRILEEESINMLFQPIVNLKDNKILGYEALCRGPRQSPLHFPDALFCTAEKVNKVTILDELARKKAIQSFMPFLNKYKLFLNMRPSNLYEYNFFKTSVLNNLESNNIDASNIVIEITEQCPVNSIIDYKKLISDLKNSGIKLALDDVGSGYSGLKTILEIEPDYLKIDMDLTKDIHKDKLKKNLMKGLISLSNYCDMKLIVEGIECREELETILELGAYAGQGYFLQKPQEAPEDISVASKSIINSYSKNKEIIVME